MIWRVKGSKIVVLLIIIFSMLVINGCSSEPEKVAVLDLNKLLHESQRASQLDQQLRALGNELEEDYQELIESDNEVGEEELKEMETTYTESRQRLENNLNQEIHEVLEEISRDKNLSIILNRQDTYHGGLDITDEVIERLDQNYISGGESSDDQE